MESVVLNVQGEMAEDLAFYLQPAGTATLWELGAFAGGTDGMDTAVDLVFYRIISMLLCLAGGAPAAITYQQMEHLIQH